MKFNILILTIFLSIGQSFACRSLRPFNQSDKHKAEVVFEGKILKYELVNSSTAKVVFDVIKTIRGEARKQWTVIYGSNTNTGPPESMLEFKEKHGSRLEVGIRKKSSDGQYNRDLRLVNAPDGYRDLPILVQGPCNPPYLIPLSAINK